MAFSGCLWGNGGTAAITPHLLLAFLQPGFKSKGSPFAIFAEISNYNTPYIVVCRKSLAFLQPNTVTNVCLFCYKNNLPRNKYLLNLLQNKTNEYRR